jgi:two-component system NtrC family sensor kinase
VGTRALHVSVAYTVWYYNHRYVANMKAENRINQKIIAFLHNLFHPHDYWRVLGADRYTSLKIRIILLDAILSLVPLFIVVTISYFWFQQILKDDFRGQLRWEIENTKQSIEFFVNERLSGLRFLSSSHTYEELSDHKILSDVFSKFKREYGGLVDIGVIDSNGIQRSYVGPYHLEGRDYSNQDWFHEIVVRASYVSDVFMGYRRIPHYAVAIKRDLPEKGTFWILRATIDMETLKRYAATINLREGDDAFIVNHEGIFQTPSRFYGHVLEKFKQCPLPQENISVKETDAQSICGFAYIKNSPWVLVTIIRSVPYGRIPKIFRNELLVISLISIAIAIAVTFVMTQTVVNRIRESDVERQEAIAKSEHASKMATIGRLAAGIAHEINNPLAIINEKAGLMKDILELTGDLNQNKNKFLGLINGVFDSVSRCRTITHNLLGFSRRIEISDVFDLNESIREVIGFIEKDIMYRNITLELDLQKDSLRIKSAKGQLQQVFLNIINNAVDAVQEGGLIKISTKAKNPDTVQVMISDNGHGIPKDELKHIFEPFYTTKEKGQGTGLGLSISYGIIQRLGGTIHVASEINKGTIFIIDIPVKTGEG